MSQLLEWLQCASVLSRCFERASTERIGNAAALGALRPAGPLCWGAGKAIAAVLAGNANESHSLGDIRSGGHGCNGQRSRAGARQFH